MHIIEENKLNFGGPHIFSQKILFWWAVKVLIFFWWGANQNDSLQQKRKKREGVGGWWGVELGRQPLPNLGLTLLCITLVTINWWKKKIHFVKIKFHLNENIYLACTLNWIIQFNSNTWIGVSIKLKSKSITFSPRIELKFNWKKWDTNGWKRYWKCSHEYDEGKNKTLKKTQIQKNHFFKLFTWEWAKHILS
jgi:hypothetical protein